MNSLAPDQRAEQLRPHAEQAYAAELSALAATDDRPRPPRWRLSPWAVVNFVLGGLQSVTGCSGSRKASAIAA